MQPGVDRVAFTAHAPRKFVDAQKAPSYSRPARADMVLTIISKSFGIDRELENSGVEQCFSPSGKELVDPGPFLKMQLQVTHQCVIGKAVNYLANAWIRSGRYVETVFLPPHNNPAESALPNFKPLSMGSWHERQTYPPYLEEKLNLNHPTAAALACNAHADCNTLIPINPQGLSFQGA